MKNINKIIALVALIMFVVVVVGGSIWIQAILWKQAWWLAISHLIVIYMAIKPGASFCMTLFKYITGKTNNDENPWTGLRF